MGRPPTFTPEEDEILLSTADLPVEETNRRLEAAGFSPREATSIRVRRRYITAKARAGGEGVVRSSAPRTRSATLVAVPASGAGPVAARVDPPLSDLASAVIERDRLRAEVEGLTTRLGEARGELQAAEARLRELIRAEGLAEGPGSGQP